MIKNLWNDADALPAGSSDDLLLLAYASRLIGCEPALALHGGGNTSVKKVFTDRTGLQHRALFIKASGRNLASMTPTDFITLDLEYLERLEKVTSLSDAEMADEFRIHSLVASNSGSSIETLLHAFLPFKYIIHTHPESILALTNRENGAVFAKDALGLDTTIIPYARVGLTLAKAASEAVKTSPLCNGLVIMQHGLVCWGESARQAYEATVSLVNKAESFLAKRRTITKRRAVSSNEAVEHIYSSIAPIIRGQLCQAAETSENGQKTSMVLQPIFDSEIREIIDYAGGRTICLTPPVTPDLIVRAGLVPMWIDSPSFNIPTDFKENFAKTLEIYCKDYSEYVKRNNLSIAEQTNVHSMLPRVILVPGLGAICTGENAEQAAIAADITRQAITTKAMIADTGGRYEAIAEEHLFDMEFRPLQKSKVANDQSQLKGRIAVVTGSAGAIGRGITMALLKAGCHVALADLPGTPLNDQYSEYEKEFSGFVMAVPMDVTDQNSVAGAFNSIVRRWGGLDIVIVNAGIAHVSPLADMDIEMFRKLEKVNVDGTLLTLRESARLFSRQGCGGDIVLVSTKNVFAPGAGFGAYSATKAAAHQLARIAVVEMAGMDVRVNMVSPDAVFSHGSVKSGLWATVGPDRMKARGLDEKGLEEYYRSRNLLKARVTAEHVANAVMFFVTRQTPTTGATIPVDGGLPDATPR